MDVDNLHGGDSVIPSHDVYLVTTILPKDMQGHAQSPEEVLAYSPDSGFAHGTPDSNVYKVGQLPQEFGA